MDTHVKKNTVGYGANANNSTSVHACKTVVWLQLTAGQGPKECAWLVAQIAKRIQCEAHQAKLVCDRVESLAFDKSLRKQGLIEPDCFLSILFRLEGEHALAFSQSWHGTIKWHGQSPYRPKHKRLNWFIGGLALTLPALSSIEHEQLKKQSVFECMRSRGAGGQHVNKTCSAVRLTHQPTGLQIRVESERSQHKNKAIALERLAVILNEQRADSERAVEQMRWQSHYTVERGRAIRTFTATDFNE